MKGSLAPGNPARPSGPRRGTLKKNFKKSKNPSPFAVQTRKELRKEKRKSKKSSKHSFLLKKFGKPEAEAPPEPKKKRRQKKTKKLSNRRPNAKNKDKEVDSGSESGTDTDYSPARLKLYEEKLKKEMEVVRRKRLVEDNDHEDRNIRALQKKLKLNKKAHVPASFRVDGLDYLLDFCNDLDAKKSFSETEDGQTNKEKTKDTEDDDVLEGSDVEGGNDEVVEDFDDDDDQDVLSNSSEAEDEVGEEKAPSDDSTDEAHEFPSDEDDGKDTDSEADSNVGEDNDEESGSVDEPVTKETEIWEDIYGRLRDKDGNVIKDKDVIAVSPTTPGSSAKYVPPMKRQLEKRDKITKSFKGLLNRLSEANMHSIATQVESHYMENSRNEMNETLLDLLSAVLIGPVLSSDRIVLEHTLLIAILHANVGTEVGAFFVQSFVHRFHELYQQQVSSEHEDGGKQLENLILVVSYLYHFKIVDCCLVYDILKLLGESFESKDVDLILTVLRTIGFRLRKDDPTALKALIQLLQQKASQAQAFSKDGSRIKFILEIVLAIRNNNMTKIPNYDPSFGEHLRKISKTFIHKGNYVSELKISLQDLLNADTKGRWWITGSAWTNNLAVPETKSEKPLYDNSAPAMAGATLANKKLMNKAKKLGMNTDTRRNIFFILMTAEDYADAYEKLVHLGLKNQLEREIIHVLIYCCLHEKKWNPYYALLASKFCALDRRFMLTTQYTIWDRLKEFPPEDPHHQRNLTELIIYLVKDKSIPLTILKVLDFSDMPSWKLLFLKEVLSGILLRIEGDILEEIFVKPGLSEKLHLFRDSLKVFMNHFMLNEHKVVTEDGEENMVLFTDPAIKERLKERIELAEKALALGRSKVQF